MNGRAPASALRLAPPRAPRPPSDGLAARTAGFALVWAATSSDARDGATGVALGGDAARLETGGAAVDGSAGISRADSARGAARPTRQTTPPPTSVPTSNAPAAM